jgi:lysozyme
MNLKNRVLVGVVSATLLTGVTMLEGTRYTPYQDIAGIVTVCQGHTGKDIVKGKVYTPAECKALLERDLKVHREGVN